VAGEFRYVIAQARFHTEAFLRTTAQTSAESAR
jgi:hypothetical protein